MTFKERLKEFRAFLLGIDPGMMKLVYKTSYTPKDGTIEAFIAEKTQQLKPLHFVQIGGNDGFIKDPIFKFVKKNGWRGIIVEPQKDVFHNKLRKTYRFEKKVKLDNVAIDKKSEVKKLYKLAISNSRWATGLATFDKETLIYQIERNYVDDRAKREGIETPEKTEDYITYEEVECLTLDDLLKKHGQSKLDLLQIDTEGYDFEIIKSINFEKVKPKIISFESEHLSSEDFEACQKLLKAQGYSIKTIDRDSIAYLD
ncbi:MAG: FkbM family methyltransferase [Flavobacteriales bacterium]|nr:FkbM family methyltransferase [Flavobacteriales bacterium]